MSDAAAHDSSDADSSDGGSRTYDGAFVKGPRVRVAATGSGVLDGSTFAVKDLIDVAGAVTGGGNPGWAARQQPALAHADCVARLLAAGASIDGKTLTDELAFSLEGENQHYGTPRNPRAPGRLPGGSSSGSAVAVAAGHVDFALGTDTGGSVRIPASFCGVYGFRPTHGRVSLDGVIPFAPGFDTVGWFARSSDVLARVGQVLLSADGAGGPLVPDANGAHERRDARDHEFGRWQPFLADDAFALADVAVAAALRPLAMSLADAIGRMRGVPAPTSAGVDILSVAASQWVDAYAVLQGAQIRQTLGPWIAREQPRFGSNIAPRFASIEAIRDGDIDAARHWQAEQRARLIAWFGRSRIVLLPTSPVPPLPLDADEATRGAFYATALAVNAIAGHCGLPQLTMPVAELEGLPIGLSMIGPPGSDLALLAIATSLAPFAPPVTP